MLYVFSNEGYILRCDDFENLHQVIKSTDKFQPKTYPFDNSEILKTVLSAIND